MRGSEPIPSASAAAEPAWHSREVLDAAQEFGADPEKGRSLDHLASTQKRSLAVSRPFFRVWGIFWNQLKGSVIVVLLAATAVSVALGHGGDAVAIGASIVFSVFFGFLTDWRADRALEALRRLSSPTARVIRGGLELEVPAADLRRGDLIVFSPGHVIVADGRISAVRDLRIDESALTGESAPVSKACEPVRATTPLAERASMAYAGTTVLSGWGRMIVTAEQGATELDRIGRLVAEQRKEETPLERQAERLGRQLALLAIGLSAGITGLGLLRGRDLWIMLETGVLLAIAAIPEGLPAVTTVALAAGVRRMARASSLIRRLAAVETLGSASVICTDKTGTLTENTMRVTTVHLPEREFEVSGSGYSPVGRFLENGSPVEGNDPVLQRLLEIAAICNDAKLEAHDGWHIHGSSTEGALLALAGKGPAALASVSSRFERLNEIAFSSDRKRMSVVARDPGGNLWSFVKGSPEVILLRCSHWMTADGNSTLNPPTRERLLAQAHAFGERGYRVLALAFRQFHPGLPATDAEEELIWVGLVGLIDPPREGVKAAIETLRGAGIRTVMITGDQKGTASTIARDLSIMGPGDLCVDSNELAGYVREHRWEDLRNTAVFARVTPEDKVTIVRALQSAGKVVAMTGDGINDAPALKASDIGIAMGDRATDVARESSDLIVTNGNYGALPSAVAEGRRIYANIRRSVQYLLLCSLSTIGVVLISVVANLPLPMSPLQILWLNLIVHIFPAVALALVPGEPAVLLRPPREPHEPLLTWRAVGNIAFRSAVVAAASIWIFTAAAVRGSVPRAQTIVMATLSLTLLTQVLASLSETSPFWRMWKSLTGPLWLAMGGGLAIQFLAVYWPPLVRVLQTEELSGPDWFRAIGMSAAAFAIVEGVKALNNRRPT